MKLRQIVVEGAILPTLEAEKRNDAIAALVDALVSADAVDKAQRDEYIKRIIAREDRASTGFGHGVAVPHVKHENITEVRLAVGVSPGGVDFRALDRKPVFAIFLVLSPSDKPEEHLDAMQMIMSNLSNPTFRNFLRQAKSQADVLTLLAEADDKSLVH